MPLSTPVHRDLTSYERRIGQSLTLRSLVCSAAAVGSAVAIGAAFTFGLRLPFDVTQLVVFPVAAANWAAGFWRPHGMKPERWAPYAARARFGRTRLVYEFGGRAAKARPHGERRGGEWDALQNEWERRGRRVRGCELWEPSGYAG